MRRLEPPREIPDRPIYLTIKGQAFRLPNDREVAELMRVISAGQLDTGDALTQFTASIDSLAAVVGAAWFHAEWELETPKPARGGDWLAFGSCVLDELHEQGLGGTAQIAEWAGELIQHFAGVLLGQEVDQVVDFGAAPTDSQTSPG